MSSFTHPGRSKHTENQDWKLQELVSLVLKNLPAGPKYFQFNLGFFFSYYRQAKDLTKGKEKSKEMRGGWFVLFPTYIC